MIFIECLLDFFEILRKWVEINTELHDQIYVHPKRREAWILGICLISLEKICKTMMEF